MTGKKNVSQFFKLLGGQAFLGVVGLICLPLIARNIGPEYYGDFSLYVLVVGVIFVFDFSRIIGVRKISQPDSHEDEAAINQFLISLSLLNGLFLLVAGFALGWLLLDISFAIPLAILGFIQSMNSPHFAAMSCKLKVGSANMIRNIAWSISYVTIVVAVSVEGLQWFYPWVFVCANAAIHLIYRYLEPMTFAPVTWTHMKQVAKACYKDVFDLSLFSIAGAVNTTADKRLVKEYEPSISFGQYTAQADLSVKLNMVSQAISNFLFPHYSVKAGKEGSASAIVLFANAMIGFSLCFFFGILFLMYWEEEILMFLLGEAFITEISYFSFFLVGVYLNFVSFMIVALQRALGNYTESRTMNLMGASSMLCFGLIFVPTYGIPAAIVTFYIPRIFDILMFLRLALMNRQIINLHIAVATFLSGGTILMLKVLGVIL